MIDESVVIEMDSNVDMRYVEYKSREFCKDVKCPVQLKLDSEKLGSEEYERIRQICRTGCKHTTWEFHHWLIDKGYLILRPEK